MAEYVMSIKKGNGLVFKTKANSLEEAKEYFRRLKQMSKEDFNELFVITEANYERKA
tara:strand:+ start:294 stop:464 length:171 start_codon:yes stop_codon:yes gene_type:complete